MMNKEQSIAVEKVKEDWAEAGTVYVDIIENNDIVYMLLEE